MKRYLYYMIPVLFILVSCDNFLDKAPDNRLRLNDLDKIAELVTNAYPSGSTVFMEWMTDNVGADPKNVQRRDMTQAFHWENIEGEGQDTPTGFWSSAYTAIAHANEALAALEEIKTTDITRKNAIRAEALACRAYAHFMLVNLFAKQYDKNTAAQDPGIVIMDDPETKLLVTYERSNVKEVYDFIEKDLLEALDKISDNYYKNSGKYHFTRNALLAFATRFYLFKNEFKACIRYATELLGENYNSRFIRNYSEIYTGTNAEMMARKFTTPALDANLLLIRKEVLYGYMGYAGYRFTEEIFKQLVLTEQDSRFTVTYNYGGSASFLPKFERELMRKLSLTSSSGYPYTIEVSFRAEEVFFNRLEAWWNEKETGLIRQYLNEYIKTIYGQRITLDIIESTYARSYPGVNRDDLLLLIILDEKRREFVEEGIRWFDIKRHRISIMHTDINGDKDILSADDPRKVLQIPTTAQEFGGLKPNIRQADNAPAPRQSQYPGFEHLRNEY